MRDVPFDIALRVPVLTVTRRTGLLIEGPEGWGEWSPLASWTPDEAQGARRFAQEAATRPFPPAVRERVDVNLMVPRITPAEAAALVAEAGCRTVKVKVGDEQGPDRVAAVRDALGPHGRVRLDANAAWDVETAIAELARLRRYDIELVEDPVGPAADLALVRRRQPIPVGAESCIRRPEDVRVVRELDAADAVVLKPQRLGGIRATLQAADDAGVPTIVSSALETSVGLAACLAVAAALPDVPYACGIGTAVLLADDVTSQPLTPVDGCLTPRRVVPDLLVTR